MAKHNSSLAEAEQVYRDMRKLADSGDTATYIARYDDLVTGKEEPVDLTGVAVSNNGIELQDREFVSAIREGREPNSSVASVIDCYRVIGELAASLEAQDGWS